MWRVEKVARKPARLDFRSSGQGWFDATQILFDDEVFANAGELTSWSEERIQVVVCPHCGFEGCEPGGWVRPRALDGAVVFLPSFEEPRSDDFWEIAETAPPEVVRVRGVPVVLGDALIQLRSYVPELPSVLEPLTEAELAMVLRFEAPRYTFRRTAEGSSFDRHAFVASSRSDLDELVAFIDSRLAHLASSHSPAKLRPLAVTDQPITLFIDHRRFEEWTPVVETEQGSLALIWGQLVEDGEGSG